MASTRDKNQPGNYAMEQEKNTFQINYNTYDSYGVPMQALYAGDGLLMGRIGREQICNNSTDVESQLFGIGSTNLVTPKAEVTPSTKSLSYLSIMKRVPMVLPQDLVIEPNQRPSN